MYSLNNYWSSTQNPETRGYLAKHESANIEIRLEKDMYYTGDTANGVVIVRINEPMEISGLNCEFIGKEHANFWTSKQVPKMRQENYQNQNSGWNVETSWNRQTNWNIQTGQNRNFNYQTNQSSNPNYQTNQNRNFGDDPFFGNNNRRGFNDERDQIEYETVYEEHIADHIWVNQIVGQWPSNQLLQTGEYSFAFNFIIGDKFPGSFEQNFLSLGSYPGSALMVYKCTANLDFNEKHQKSIRLFKDQIIRIIQKPSIEVCSRFMASQDQNFDRAGQTGIKKHSTDDIKTWCCKREGRIVTTAHFDKEVYNPGEQANCLLNIDNSQNSLKVNAVKATLKAEMSLNIRGHHSDEGTVGQENVEHLDLKPGNRKSIKLNLNITDKENFVTCTGKFFQSKVYFHINVMIEGWFRFCNKDPSFKHEVFIMNQENIDPFLNMAQFSNSGNYSQNVQKGNVPRENQEQYKQGVSPEYQQMGQYGVQPSSNSNYPVEPIEHQHGHLGGNHGSEMNSGNTGENYEYPEND